ncbi:MAG TPA: CsbD family protein [Chthoniobacterales bacterium]|nr:CsbD family protein [Chthoniobacterales bacterium]
MPPLRNILRAVESRIEYMKSSTKDKAKGRLEQAKGVVKEKAGRASGNPRTQDSGTGAKAKGTVRNKVGDVKKVFSK